MSSVGSDIEGLDVCALAVKFVINEISFVPKGAVLVIAHAIAVECISLESTFVEKFAVFVIVAPLARELTIPYLAFVHLAFANR